MAAKFFLLLIFLAPSVLFAATVQEISKDAEASLFYGDFFHAYRSYSYISEEHPDMFAKLGLDGYLTSLFVIAPEKKVKEECSELLKSKDSKVADKAAYLCGKHFVEFQQSDDAESVLKAIPNTSNFYWPAQIIRASAALIANDPARALNYLKPADIKQYTRLGLADEFFITLARVYTAENKFDESLKNYQSITNTSVFYIEAQVETAWVFFKMRRFESAQVLLDVLIGHYESGQRVGNNPVSFSTYYKARYLKAYLALAEKRTEGASAAFADLKGEYERALQKVKPSLDGDAMIKAVRDQNLKWTDVKNMPPSLKEQLDLIGEWIGADTRKKFEREVHYQMALSREIARAEKYQDIYSGENKRYVEMLEALQDDTWALFSHYYGKTVKKLAKDMETLRIKAELGRLEIVWLKRAEGARSLDEVIDNYRQEVRSIDELMER